jgi:hypothetical protein
MCRQNASVLNVVHNFAKKYQQFKTSCSLQSLVKLFLECLKLCRRTIIVIDAVDECINCIDLLRELLHIMKAEDEPMLNIFMTSREEHNITQYLRDVPQLSLSRPEVSSDIDIYIRSQLDKLTKARELKINNEKDGLLLRQEVFDMLSSKADGM